MRITDLSSSFFPITDVTGVLVGSEEKLFMCLPVIGPPDGDRERELAKADCTRTYHDQLWALLMEIGGGS